MTTPTQAQIEAARAEYCRVIAKAVDDRHEVTTQDGLDAIAAAIIAAAQVGEPKRHTISGSDAADDDDIPAAQVGEQVQHKDWCLSRDAYVPDEGKCNCGAIVDCCTAFRNATIERCAQYLAERGWIEAAGELSKLKDEP